MRLPLWVEEVYALLLATRTATTHRHLKQTVLQADALNACAIRSLEEIQITFPLLSSELDQLVNNSRVSAKRGGAKKETSVDSIVSRSTASPPCCHKTDGGGTRRTCTESLCCCITSERL